MAVTKKPAKKSTKKPMGKTESEQHQKIRRQMTAVILFTVGVLLLCIELIPGSGVWMWAKNFLYGLFGITALLIPVALIYIAIMATLDKPFGEIGNKLWQTGVLIALICGLVEIFSKKPFAGDNFFGSIANLYINGGSLKSGGVFSAIVGWPLLTMCGKTGAIIIIFLFLFAFIMLLTGTTLIGFFRSFVKPVKKIEETYSQMREAQEIRNQQKFDINVDLGPNDSDSGKSVAKKDAKRDAKKAADMAADMATDMAADMAADAKIKSEMNLPDEVVLSKKPTLEELLELEKQNADELKFEDIQAESIKKAAQKSAVSQAAQESMPLNIDNLDSDIKLNNEISIEAVSDIEFETVENSLSNSNGEYSDAKEDKGSVESQEPQNDISNKIDELVNEAFSAHKKKSEPLPAFVPSEQATSYVDDSDILNQYHYPPTSLLKAPKNIANVDVSGELQRTAELLVDTLKSFGVQTKIVDISRGPTVTRYELQPSAGVKISKITGLSDDIAMNLATAGVRIEAPIPNKAAVGIEVPNKITDIVTMREIIESTEFDRAQSKISVALGKDIAGNAVIADISKMPHMLIAGSTGSGKSVCINSFIMSLLYKASPSEVRLLMVDPKVVELGIYNGIPHLLVPVVTDPRKAAGALAWAVTEMLNRYKLFADNNVRDLLGYNILAQESEDIDPMPQIVIIIDELADLMMAAPNEVEDSICRLAQMARAAGMHLIIATQRPSVDIITGVIKANIPSRIAFAVSSQVDSRTILDGAGAEKLLGRGDMLFYPVGMPKPLRVQGCYVSEKEIEQVVNFVKNKEDADYDDKIIEEIEKQAVLEKGATKDTKDDGGGFSDDDELLNDAIECVIDAGQASTSYLQRKLKVGYARAARLIDEMESRNIVGEFEGSKPRQVMYTRQQWIEMKMRQDANNVNVANKANTANTDEAIPF